MFFSKIHFLWVGARTASLSYPGVPCKTTASTVAAANRGGSHSATEHSRTVVTSYRHLTTLWSPTRSRHLSQLRTKVLSPRGYLTLPTQESPGVSGNTQSVSQVCQPRKPFAWEVEAGLLHTRGQPGLRQNLKDHWGHKVRQELEPVSLATVSSSLRHPTDFVGGGSLSN